MLLSTILTACSNTTKQGPRIQCNLSCAYTVFVPGRYKAGMPFTDVGGQAALSALKSAGDKFFYERLIVLRADSFERSVW